MSDRSLTAIIGQNEACKVITLAFEARFSAVCWSLGIVVALIGGCVFARTRTPIERRTVRLTSTSLFENFEKGIFGAYCAALGSRMAFGAVVRVCWPVWSCSAWRGWQIVSGVIERR